MKPVKILCYGEVLWDCLPRGLFLGGAPMNVAAHLHRLGCHPLPVSAVGKDFLGELALERLDSLGLETGFIKTIPNLQTGAVKVKLNKEGNATYDILEPVAWDRIPVNASLMEAAAGCQAIVYGSLAQRSAQNRRSLSRLLGCRNLYRVLDVNLRPPYDDVEQVRNLAKDVHLLKLNEEELFRLLGEDGRGKELREATARLGAGLGVERICVTLGNRGAGFLDGEEWRHVPGRKVKVVDTVGAGDAFLAAFVHGLLQDRLAPQDALERACRLGEFIATQDGAVPEYDPDRIC